MHAVLFSTDARTWQPLLLDTSWKLPNISNAVMRYLQLLRGAKDEPETDVQPSGDLIERYLQGEWLPVASSNVRTIRYLPEDEAEEVEFYGGGSPAFYAYSNVTPRIARDFAEAPSKGKWLWSNFRKRGTVYGFNPRHPYTFISGLSEYQPHWMEEEESRLAHGRIGPGG